jgi:hypothetical protein
MLIIAGQIQFCDTPMLPRLFIGSSKEGLKYVTYIEKKLKDHADCSKWTDDRVFAPNRSVFEVLIKQAKLADFALLVATADDVTTSLTREGSRNTIRDNVIFEHGLFLGATSIDRAFLFVQEGADLPSDFNGVSTLTFSESIGTYNHIDIVIEHLIKRIEQANKQHELGFVPSTALAMGYFNSFVKSVCEALGRDQKLLHKQQERVAGSYNIKIILPDNIDDGGVNEFANKYYRMHNMESADTVVLQGAQGRSYPFRFKIDPPQKGHDNPLDVHVVDVPTTLNTIQDAIKLYFPQGYIGPDEDKEQLEKRELRNFANVLRHFISKNPWTRNHVEVIEDVQV